jgi:hypothetical protein
MEASPAGSVCGQRRKNKIYDPQKARYYYTTRNLLLVE